MLKLNNMNDNFARLLAICVNQEELNQNVIKDDFNLLIEAINLLLYISPYVEVTIYNNVLEDLMQHINENCIEEMCHTIKLLTKHDKNYFQQYKSYLKNNLDTFINTELNIAVHLIELYLKITSENNDELDIKICNSINILIINILKSNKKSLIQLILFQLIPIYTSIQHNRTLNDLRARIWELLQETENLTLLYTLENILLPTEWNKTIFSIITAEQFWKMIQKYVVDEKGFNQKMAVQLLRRCFNLIATYEEDIDLCDGVIIYNPTHRNEFLAIFSALCTILEVLREKQIHLVEPALNLLMKIQNLHSTWLLCVYKLMLEHTQKSVNYFAVKTILSTNWYMKNRNDFKIIMYNIMVCVNQGEYNKYAQDVYVHLKRFCSELNNEQFLLLIEISLDVKWVPVSLYCYYNAFYTNFLEGIELTYKLIERIVNQLTTLPDKYIRLVCTRIIIDFMCSSYLLHQTNLDEFKKIFGLFNKMNFIQNVCKTCKDYPNFNGFALEDNTRIPELNWDFIIKKLLKQGMSEKYLNEILERIFSYANQDVIDYEILDLLQAITHYEERLLTDDLKKRISQITFRNEFTDKLHAIIVKKLNWHEVENYIVARFFVLKANDNVNDLKLLYLKSKRSIDLKSKIANTALDILNNASNYNNTQIGFALYFLSKIPQANIMDILHENTQILMWNNVDISISFTIISRNYIKNMNSELKLFLCQFLIEATHKNQNVSLIYNALKCLVELRPHLTDEHYSDTLANVMDNIKNFCYSYELIQILQIYLDSNLSNVLNQTDFEVMDKVMELVKSNYFLKIEITDQYYLNYLIEILLFEDVIKKHDRYEYEIILTTRQIEDDYLTDREYMLRHAVQQIQKLCNTSNSLIIINELALLLIERYSKTFNKRYFPDSQILSEKMKIVQSLLLIYHKCTSETRTKIEEFAMNSLCNESHQNCVKQLLQWLIILLFYNKAYHILEFVNNMITEATHKSAVVSFIPILYHLSKQENEQFYESFILMYLPLTMGPHFKLRLHAQFIIHKLYKHAMQRGFQCIVEKWRNTYNVIEIVLNATDAALKEEILINEDFLDNFDPHLHYSLEMIYLILPKLNDSLQSQLDLNYNQLYENDTCISVKTKNRPLFKRFYKNCADRNEKQLETSKYLQKKIVPVNTNASNKTELILITNLIDSPANLGGLTRTSEIYGIKQLVINNSNVLCSKEYKSLSMSAEEWVDIIEIKEKDLIAYLQQLKSQSYTLIGLEQTDSSRMLNDFKFPQKSVLLLGNEKEGIPAKYISLLDICLEIPQFGVTRSLNVHVAGAICIWEYTKCVMEL